MMNRRTFSATLAAGVRRHSGQLRQARAQAASKARNVVLVHGAYADGSCWSEVVGILQQAGFKATVVQHPLTTLEAGVEATRRAIALQDGPTVLVGHFLCRHDRQRGRDGSKSCLACLLSRRVRRMRAKTTRRLARLLRRRPPPPGLSGPKATASSARRLFLRDFPAVFLARRRASSMPSRVRSLTRTFHRKDNPGRLALEAKAGMPSRPRIADQPGSRALHGQAQNAKTIEVTGKPSVAALSPARDRPAHLAKPRGSSS